VDLREPANTGKSRNSRFLKKILTDAEIEFVQNAENPDMALWSLWACKETAYKVIKKSFPDAAFLPRRWAVIFNPARLGFPRHQPEEGFAAARGRSRYYCEPTAPAGGSTKFQSVYSYGEVVIPGKDRVYIRLTSNPQYVHCVGADVLTALDKLIWSVDALPEKEKINPSLYLRNYLGQSLAKHFSGNFRHIKIKRTRENGELQPPLVYINGRKTDIDISLSHDGRFIAYVVSQTEKRTK
jgi:phosphopantetheinyl transferase (holo-ACP synthase)